MRIHEAVRFTALLLACAGLLLAQGLTTTARPTDWEEINFEFDSSVLTDGYPSLLRLAELLGQNPGHRVTLEGNTDSIGSAQYNERLSRARAETVRAFLVKYGARENQIEIVAHGQGRPTASNQTREGRFMNRRVQITVRDAQGRIVSDGGIGDAIKAMEEIAKKQEECCGEILKRLDKLDDILAAIRDLKAENDKLRQELADLRQAQAGIRTQIEEAPRPPERAELAQMMEATAQKAVEQAKPSRFALLGLNVGPTLGEVQRPGALPGEVRTFGAGNISFSGKGRYFAPFGRTEMHALQAEGEYMFYRDRQEGQFDFGLVNRFRPFQLGLFSSIKHVTLTDLGGGTLGQAAFTADFVLPRGRIGMFGTKGYLNDRVIARRPFQTAQGLVSFNVMEESLLRIADQIGGSGQAGLWGDAYVDATVGALFRTGGTNRLGAMARLVQPFHPNWAFTVEADLNETFLGPNNTGRIVFGLRFGNWLRPRQYANVRHPVPVEVPRLRYELLTRTVRTGNAPPVADAGPDQIGAPAGTIVLDGSGSFDPDGDPLTFQWTQIGGPPVELSAPTAERTTFTAAEGHTYNFRLLVRDSQGAQGTDSVMVTTRAAPQVRILRFTAEPASIVSGQTSTLVWQVENAETVEITTLGQVNPQAGTATVTPTETTTYTLTARNPRGEVSQTVTVTVTQPQVAILLFQASPASITAGQSSTLLWQTQNADEVSISGIGPVALSGSTSVSPAQTTTYTLTARNRFGEATAQVTVQVTAAPAPVIVSFTAVPPEILEGGTSTLAWQVQNATEVTISEIGSVAAAGSRAVSPGATTTYTLTASNAAGQVTASVTVTVIGRVRITSFTATPASVAPGAPVVLSWTTENAAAASISGIGPVTVSGSVTVMPTATTTYTLTAVGRLPNDTAEATVTVQVAPPAPPLGALQCDAGPNRITTVPTITLQGQVTSDPAGGLLRFSWNLLSGGPVEIVNARTTIPTVTFESLGRHLLQFYVANEAGQECTANVTVDFVAPTE